MIRHSAVLTLVLSCAVASYAQQPEPVRLAGSPALSPDGQTLAFAWRGDIWTVPAAGGVARQLTVHPADDGEPRWSPDGHEIAFTSDRGMGRQVYVMAADGGEPEQITWHTAGYSLADWAPNGTWLLARGAGDTSWAQPSRLWRIPRRGDKAPELLFDDYGDSARIAPDGKRVAFTREGEAWWRKGYRGSHASQIWLYADGSFRKVLALETECRWPLWRADGEALYYAGAEGGAMNLRECDLRTGVTRALTAFTDDSVVFPCISRDGSTVVFRRLFDLYRYRPGKDAEPVRIDITVRADAATAARERRVLDKASQAAFSPDGLEIAFIAGGDLWVMDSVLREPKQVTSTPEEERDPAFATDGSALLFVSDAGGRTDLWRADRSDASRYWWRNDTFTLRKLTDDEDAESSPVPAPDGSRFAFVKRRGDLWTMTPDGKDARRLFESWSAPDFDWSPDGKWIAYAIEDNDFNSDIWIRPADGGAAPVNVSRHPDNESGPAWSPDGRCLAFTGRRHEGEVDIFYVWLRRQDDERAKRDRTMDEALEAMKKGRKAKIGKPEKGDGEDEPPKKPDGKPPVVTIDFEDIHERVRRIELANSTEGGLFWKSDSKRLGFFSTINGLAGTYAVDFPEIEAPKLITARTGWGARWLEEGDRILMLSDGIPGAYAKGAWKAFTFGARQSVELAARNRAAFLQAWRTIRDTYYDERLGNRDWNVIRRKYEDAAAASPDVRALSDVVNLMLGELNGSHLAFWASGGGWQPPDGWHIATPFLGVRWDPAYPGPGLRVSDVLPGGPADRAASRLVRGDLVLRIDGAALNAGQDLARALNGPLDRDIRFTVLTPDGGRVSTERRFVSRPRRVLIRPVAWSDAGGLLYNRWIRDRRRKVDAASGGTLGYVHIRGMDWPSFQQFERDLYAAGAGKDGLIIDVRENGGGFTADHLLTILGQPDHAVTVPRGGGPGYPQDRLVYATWRKPIIVLCNQNSFSNAEIFSHAIKTLRRGRLVGVPTAGGVISTGGTSIMDVGFLRLPFRGWFLRDTGADMELNGAIPDAVVWPEPGDFAKGLDRQLDKAVELLLEDVKAWKEKPRPELKKASER